MRTVCVCMVLTALVVGGCATGKGESYSRAGFNFATLDKVAVLEVAGAVRGDAVKNQIGDFFAMELLKRGYTPVERSQVQALLKEQEFQASGITSDLDAAKAGNILNVPAVMLINIPTYKEEMNMTAKIVDVQDGSVLWLGSGSGSTGKTFSTFLGAAAGAAAGAVVAGGDTRDRVAGGVIGGVLGGVAGQALSPQQAEQVQKLIKKVCESMPPRMPGVG
ncbi:MAG: glycine zipper 2TM domain-containing protein [Phycisphaerales bacterium]|nr:MAG: glycine zipper 2TM domain-containing protein [Phycisphaerales bacterium]